MSLIEKVVSLPASKLLVCCIIVPPVSVICIRRSISNSMAFLILRIEFKFLTSTLVPNVVAPFKRIEILASHLKLPSSILPSQIPIQRTSFLTSVTNKKASSAECIQGSVTISIKGVPARFKSIKVSVAEISCILLPASSSK